MEGEAEAQVVRLRVANGRPNRGGAIKKGVLSYVSAQNPTEKAILPAPPDISDGRPRVFPVKKPRDPRRALLWEHGFRRRDEVESPPSYEEFEGQYCYLYDEKGRWTGGHAPHFVYRSEHLFIGYVREAVRYQGFQRAWWMHRDCTLEEVEEAVKGLGGLRRDYAEEGTGYK